MNESLRRALLRARLSEEDVAARLQVDPKTVRRWLEGRVPYPRHRWLLAGALGLDEVDLWPQLMAPRSIPADIKAIYPHREDIPRETWLHFFGSAEREIDILDVSGLFLATDDGVLATLSDRSRSGVTVRVCLRDPDTADFADAGHSSGETSAAYIRQALARYRILRENNGVELRLHRTALNNSIYLADNELLVVQQSFGASIKHGVALHLRRRQLDDMFTTYLESLKRILASSEIAPR